MSNPQTIYVTSGLEGGGAERLLTNILLQQTSRGDSIQVISILPGGAFRRTLEDAGINVIDLGRKRDLLRAAIDLARIFREVQPSTVYAWMYEANIVAFFALLFAGLMPARLFFGVFCTELVPGYRGWKFRAVRALNALCSRFVTGVIYNAGEARAFHRSIGFRERRSIVISNVVDPSVFQHDPVHRCDFRKELGAQRNDIVVAVLARVDPMKDWETIRAAVRDLPNVITVALGKSTDEFPPQHRFIGLGWREDVVRILSGTDIFLLGSAFGEGTSLALTEAMLCGLPCIATDVGGNATLLGDAGVIVKTRNPHAIRDAIVELANDPMRRAALGRAARARASEIVTFEDPVGQLHSLSIAGEAMR
jgi:glycosyltransferase involved in cell wall biosynthesis